MLRTLALMATLTAAALLGACAAPEAPITQVCSNQDPPTGSNIIQRKKRQCEETTEESREQARERAEQLRDEMRNTSGTDTRR